MLVVEVNVESWKDAPLQSSWRRSLASVAPDRGKEFTGHAEVTAALGGVQFYFRQPHRLWQKPTVENTNGLQGVLPEGHGFLEGDAGGGGEGLSPDK